MALYRSVLFLVGSIIMGSLWGSGEWGVNCEYTTYAMEDPLCTTVTTHIVHIPHTGAGSAIIVKAYSGSAPTNRNATRCRLSLLTAPGYRFLLTMDQLNIGPCSVANLQIAPTKPGLTSLCDRNILSSSSKTFVSVDNHLSLNWTTKTSSRARTSGNRFDPGDFFLIITVTTQRAVECAAQEVRCTLGYCIDNRLECDGYNNCGDESDENACNTLAYRTNIALFFAVTFLTLLALTAAVIVTTWRNTTPSSPPDGTSMLTQLDGHHFYKHPGDITLSKDTQLESTSTITLKDGSIVHVRKRTKHHTQLSPRALKRMYSTELYAPHNGRSVEPPCESVTWTQSYTLPPHQFYAPNHHHETCPPTPPTCSSRTQSNTQSWPRPQVQPTTLEPVIRPPSKTRRSPIMFWRGSKPTAAKQPQTTSKPPSEPRGPSPSKPVGSTRRGTEQNNQSMMAPPLQNPPLPHAPTAKPTSPVRPTMPLQLPSPVNNNMVRCCAQACPRPTPTPIRYPMPTDSLTMSQFSQQTPSVSNSDSQRACLPRYFPK